MFELSSMTIGLEGYVLYFNVAFDGIIQTLIDRRFDPSVLIGGEHHFSNLECGGLSSFVACKCEDGTRTSQEVKLLSPNSSLVNINEKCVRQIESICRAHKRPCLYRSFTARSVSSIGVLLSGPWR